MCFLKENFFISYLTEHLKDTSEIACSGQFSPASCSNVKTKQKQKQTNKQKEEEETHQIWNVKFPDML